MVIGSGGIATDIRNTDRYDEARALFQEIWRPGLGEVSDASELHVSPDGRRVVFTGVMCEALEGSLPTRICEVDLLTGALKVLSDGPNSDRTPKYSVDGRRVAFLSDRARSGDFQLYLLDLADGSARGTAPIDGWVEYLHWSPDGERVLLGVADRGADVSSGQGAAAKSDGVADAHSSWFPAVDAGDDTGRWRRVWVYDVEGGVSRCVTPPNLNVWEAVWCGNW